MLSDREADVKREWKEDFGGGERRKKVNEVAKPRKMAVVVFNMGFTFLSVRNLLVSADLLLLWSGNVN